MEPQTAIEVFGTITKQETVMTITDKVLPGSLVFEAIAPFPGYYHETPDTAKPVYMYLALQEQYPLTDIIRATAQVEKVFDENFEAGKGILRIHNHIYNVLRVRHLKRYDLIGQLQQSYQDQGICFMQKTMRGLEEVVQIRVVKFFNLHVLDEGIYLDRYEAFHAYIEIPKHYNWNEFNCLTDKVKYNWEESKFDAAMGSFYYQGQLHEFVRIYSNKLSLHYLQELRKLYLQKIK
ncbi:MAG: hypothetical protein AAGU19_08365 [Prolixibacteraceae bacterium]